MGIVVAATHIELGHRVAIKLLRDEMAQSPTIVERFLREARSVVGLRTEHVCRVIDVGRLETGAPFIVMEMLEGMDLQQAVRNQPLPVTMAVEYVLQACVALAEAHAAGIIHRDLKPANLFVTRRADGGPLVKVLDFGIAKALADTGAHLTHQSAMGSPGYMSPEQIQSARDVDVRTDLWALGVTLYQLVSARMPFPASSHTEIAIKVATEPPAPLDVDPALRAVIWKCLEKRPADRFSTIGELVTALAPLGRPAATPAPEPAEPPRRRAWPLLVVSTLLALVIGGAVAAVVWFRRPAPGAAVAVPDARALAGHLDVGVDVRIEVIDAGDPWKSNDAPSIPLPDAYVAPPRPVTPVFHPPTKQQILMMQQCAAIMTGKKVGIRQLARCVCGSNPASGTAYLSTLKGDDLVQASDECKKLGVVPP
jgi:serine/threonine-protein kinase